MKAFHPNFPFSPKRLPFYYGWVVALAGTLGVVASIPGQTMGVSAFNESLLEVLNLDRSGLSHAYLAGTLLSGLLLPFAGKLYDRMGDRRLGVLACVGMGANLLLLSYADRMAQFLGNGTMATLILMGILFFLLRFTGQGVLTMVSRTMVSKWFRRHRGLVIGCSGVVVSFSFGYAPRFLHQMVSSLGWREAWQALGMFTIIGMGLLAWLLFRDTPESCSLKLDAGGDGPDENLPEEPSFTWKEAQRTTAFWGVALALFAQGLIVTALTFHLEALATGQGLSGQEGFAIFLPMSIIATVTGFLAGWYCDKGPIRWLVFFMMLFLALACWGTTRLDSHLGYWVTVAGLGLSGGCFNPLSAVALPNYFGREHIGEISGRSMSIVVIGSALGPSILSVLLRGEKDFSDGFLFLTSLPLMVVVLTFFMRTPRQ
jgi:MFS transporter, OFA family, oxalate/formate antiporter